MAVFSLKAITFYLVFKMHSITAVIITVILIKPRIKTSCFGFLDFLYILVSWMVCGA